MRKRNRIFLIVLIFNLIFSSDATFAQKRKKRVTNSDGSPQMQCRGGKTLTSKMSYQVGAGKVSSAEKDRIEKTYGFLTVPEGESKRAEEIHRIALDYRSRELEIIKESYVIWQKMHPNATPEEIEDRRKIQQQAIEYVTDNPIVKKRIAARKWDWREHGIDVGPVLDQGDDCSTCWAFAASDAAAASLQKVLHDDSEDRGYHTDDNGMLISLVRPPFEWVANPTPFVQDLLNCMEEVPKENVCKAGWHGWAFNFMVYGKGIPMAVADGYQEPDKNTGQLITYRREYKMRQKFECKPNFGFVQATSWDYVSAKPDKVPPVEELKRALIEHGPLASLLVYDDCLVKYRGGVFNEKDNDIRFHAVLLIGWDDQKQAWLVKNSWGEDWGEKGFGWIKYGSNNFGVFAAWIDAERDIYDTTIKN